MDFMRLCTQFQAVLASDCEVWYNVRRRYFLMKFHALASVIVFAFGFFMPFSAPTITPPVEKTVQSSPRDAAYLVGRWWFDHYPENARDGHQEIYFAPFPIEEHLAVIYVIGSFYDARTLWGNYIPEHQKVTINWLQDKTKTTFQYTITRGDYGRFDLKMHIETSQGEFDFYSRVDNNF